MFKIQANCLGNGASKSSLIIQCSNLVLCGFLIKLMHSFNLLQLGSPVERITSSASHPLILLTKSHGSISQHCLLLQGLVTEVPSILNATDKHSRSITCSIWHVQKKLNICGYSCRKYGIQNTTITFSSIHDFHSIVRRKRT
jgi:hypothetical protein